MGYSLLCVTADEKFAQLVFSCASGAGYSLELAAKAAAGLEAAVSKRPDLVILDMRLGDMAGLAWIKMLRSTDAGREIPLMAAADRKIDSEVASAFDWGADDYILKQLEAVELSARCRAVLRRRFEREETLGPAVSVGPITLDPGRHECRVRDKIVALKAREFELLEILMRKAGRVLSRAYLLETVWGMSRQASTRAVDVGVSRLRKSLGARAGRLIETVERFGYRLREQA